MNHSVLRVDSEVRSSRHGNFEATVRVTASRSKRPETAAQSAAIGCRVASLVMFIASEIYALMAEASEGTGYGLYTDECDGLIWIESLGGSRTEADVAMRMIHEAIRRTGYGD